MLEGFFPTTAMPDADWWQALWPSPSEVLNKLGIGRASNVVDLCCGDGLFTVPLARIAHHVVAIDLDPAMLDLARARAEATGVANCVFLAGNAYDLDTLVPDPQDFILIANTFHGVPDKQRLARGVMSVLRPGGRFAVINWHRRPREETVVFGQPRGPPTEMRMTPEDVRQAVVSAGLQAVMLIDLPPYHYAAMLERPPSET